MPGGAGAHQGVGGGEGAGRHGETDADHTAEGDAPAVHFGLAGDDLPTLGGVRLVLPKVCSSCYWPVQDWVLKSYENGSAYTCVYLYRKAMKIPNSMIVMPNSILKNQRTCTKRRRNKRGPEAQKRAPLSARSPGRRTACRPSPVAATSQIA